MPRIAGVKTQKDSRGNVTHVTIDVKKHKEAIPVLRELGLMEKTQFEKDCEAGMTVAEFEQRLQKHIDTLPWKK